MSNIMLAGVVLLTLAFLAPAFQWLPEAALAAIVINAMAGSANPHALRVLWRIDKIDFALGFATFFVVLAFDLLPAMITGIVLSIVYVVYRISFPGRSVLGRDPNSGDYVTKSWLYGGRSGEPHKDAVAVPGVIIYRFASPLVFSNSEAFTNAGEKLLIGAAAKGELPHALVIDFEEVFAVDTTGSAAIISLFHYARRYDVELLLARVHSGAHELLEVTGVIDELGEACIFDTIHDAVASVEAPPAPSTPSS
jgi:MFS superfamily sulfate permease-like transporter